MAEKVALALSEFTVKGPAEPVVALLGADATLPCQLTPEQSAAYMHIRWYRTQLSSAVLVYYNGQEQGGEQMLEYRGRTELVRDTINKGSVALKIQRVRTSDNGQYRCYFKDGDASHEAIVQLNVIGLGSVPDIYMAGLENDGIKVLCSSKGWFPKPTVKWRDMAGVKSSLFESQDQNEDGLFKVEASLVVTDSSLDNVTCSIQNPLSGQEKMSAIFLPEPFFPRVSPWKTALAGTLPVLVLLLTGIGYFGWKEHKAKEVEIKKKEVKAQESKQMKLEKEAAINQRETLKKELEQRKALYKEDWKKALLYPDWRMELFSPATVTIKGETLPQNNSDPDNKESVREETKDLSFSNKRVDDNFIILHQGNFTSGRYFWKVVVGDTDEWALGVVEDTLQDTSSNIFRVLEKKGDQYKACTYNSKTTSEEVSLSKEAFSQVIVVFFDYEDGDISFYNMTEGTHIYSFTKLSFSGSHYPYYKRNSTELS
ncbi:PREDICTED: butyrophilin-like protein 1-like [Elephantulus edwardii]|uniref:butyrophilin-like protein 1-like n=1 Tax=Elephantulus edwardii TaxID=28737 RepID=UPI0003F0BF89|nr:PREDICTED: butyrophilin-like protein 1-like [Elephantulus edwardii]